MGKRKQPFGYRMKMGEIVLHPQEANLVAYIFQQYIAGATFNTLVQELKDQPIPYYEGKAWNKNMVARILEDRRYTGESNYPAIIQMETLERALVKRCAKQAHNQKTDAQKLLCRLSGHTATERTEQQVLNLLNSLIRNPDLIKLPYAVSPIVSDESQLQDELNTAMGYQPIDEDAAQRLILSIAAAQYSAIGSGEYETARLQRVFSQCQPVTELDAEMLRSTVSAIQIYSDGSLDILSNEKYCGDVLLQKTYISDCISRKVIRNTGQLPMYLVQNNHDGIVDRKTFDAVQAEKARRNAGKSPSKKNAPTGKTSYASKYALSERLVCGECGTLYRRCTWAKRGKKRVVWRCVSRLDYGTKYCHNSPTLDEKSLQRSTLAAINSAMSRKNTLIRQITGAMELELAPVPGVSLSLSDIDRRVEELNHLTRDLVSKAAREEDASAYTASLKAVMEEATALKMRRTFIEEQRENNNQAIRRIADAVDALEHASAEITEWDESLIRQLVDTVKVVSANKIIVYLRGGIQIEQDMIQ